MNAQLAAGSPVVPERSPLPPVCRLMLLGVPRITHVGRALLDAAERLGLETELINGEEAFAGSAWLRRVHWWLLGHRPPRLRAFSRQVCARAERWRPDCLLTTGLAALDVRAARDLRANAIRLVNFSTDDPWSRAQGGSWFRRSLPAYSSIFSPRASNLEDFRRLGCRDVRYLPFAYDPSLHFVEPPGPGMKEFACDVVFVGGADRDRHAWMRALVRAGINLHLWGGYWSRLPEFQPLARGHADLPTMRRAVAGASISLCLVRRANRDGHAMRSFEVPAMGGCMLTEDTGEHREILGPEGECTVYFRDEAEMVQKARWLIDHPEERKRLAASAHARITGGKNTYADRLKTMLELVRGQ